MDDNPGSEFVHPSEDPRVIAGQGTVGVEIVKQMKEMEQGVMDVVVIPVGGGGLASGNIMSIKSRWPGCKVVLAEPEIVDDAKRSFESKTLQGHPGGKAALSVADGLKTTLGPNFLRNAAIL